MKYCHINFLIKRISFTPLFFLINFLSLHAQHNSAVVESLQEKMDLYSLSKPAGLLYVHFDKNIYGSGQQAWFAAYILRSDIEISAYNTLSVALIRNDDRSIWAENKFVLHNAISSGSISIPDTIPPGNYHFIAYTNVMKNSLPNEIFTQPITVKTNVASFAANLVLTDSLTSATDTAHIKVKVTTREMINIPTAEVRFTLGDGADSSSFQKLKTDKNGETIISIPSQQVQRSGNIVNVLVKNEFEYEEMTLKLPALIRKARVTFYPEGGNIIDQTTCVVGWEVKNGEGQPLLVSGILYENKKAIDTIQTNEYGLGKFKITASRNNNYQVKVFYSGSKDTMYDLPKIIKTIPAISVTNAITTNNLELVIQNLNAVNRHLFLLLHNYRQIFVAYSVNNNKSSSETKQISLDKIPKGLTTITLIDSTGKPLAERMFFAHYDQKPEVIINTDSTEYFTRQKVQLSLRLQDTKNKPVNGIVSVACVQNASIDSRKMNDIESYSYLTNELQHLPLRYNVLTGLLVDNDYLEDVLLIKGWRRYTWQDMLLAKATDTIQVTQTLKFKGVVTRNTKTTKKEIQLALVVDSTLNNIKTDNAGNFELPSSSLIAGADKPIVLFINEKTQALYKLNLTDEYFAMNEKLAKKQTLEKYNDKTEGENTDSLLLKRYEHQMVLAAVKVKSKTPYSGIFAGTLRVYRGICSDFVCINWILNCENHRKNPTGVGLSPNFNVRPVTGQQYLVANVFGEPETVIYKGTCDDLQMTNEFTLPVKGIYTAKEFYSEDYSKLSLDQPLYLSTIYWKASLPVSSASEVKLSFYTGDISGRFRIIVQGITSDDIINGEHFFTVKEK